MITSQSKLNELTKSRKEFMEVNKRLKKEHGYWLDNGEVHSVLSDMCKVTSWVRMGDDTCECLSMMYGSLRLMLRSVDFEDEGVLRINLIDNLDRFVVSSNHNMKKYGNKFRLKKPTIRKLKFKG